MTPLHIILENNDKHLLNELLLDIKNLLGPNNSNKWNLAHFIDFRQEAGLGKIFLDYSY